MDQNELNGLVEELVVQSFGKGFHSNRLLIEDCECGDSLCITNKPYHIVKTWPSEDGWLFKLFPFLSQDWYAGRFTEPDGSSLEVLHSYEKQARAYAEQYMRRTGKPVKLKFVIDVSLGLEISDVVGERFGIPNPVNLPEGYKIIK